MSAALCRRERTGSTRSRSPAEERDRDRAPKREDTTRGCDFSCSRKRASRRWPHRARVAVPTRKPRDQPVTVICQQSAAHQTCDTPTRQQRCESGAAARIGGRLASISRVVRASRRAATPPHRADDSNSRAAVAQVPHYESSERQLRREHRDRPQVIDDSARASSSPFLRTPEPARTANPSVFATARARAKSSQVRLSGGRANGRELSLLEFASLILISEPFKPTFKHAGVASSLAPPSFPRKRDSGSHARRRRAASILAA